MQMDVIVQKYGGSSVADVDKLGRVADKIVATRKSGHNVVVAISAMGKTTDQLIALAKQISPHPPRRELDMLLSTGERVSMALLCMAIQDRGCDAISFTGSQSGIITNDRHFDARIIEVRPHRIEDELARGKIVVVAGYQGMSYKREITTLGRGGTDTTALALAAALGAKQAEIYSDVDGVYTADPRVVPDARHLPTLSYESMQEMAEAGAKVLHAAAVEFARRAKIEILARSTFTPGRETRVRDGASEGRAVVGQKGACLLRVPHAELSRVLETCEARGLSVLSLEGHEGHSSLVIGTSLAPDWSAAREQLAAQGVDVSDPLGFVSYVDERKPSIWAKATSLMKKSFEPLSMHASPLRVSFLVHEKHTDDAVRALHEEVLGA